MQCACGLVLSVNVVSRAGVVLARWADCPRCGQRYGTDQVPPQPHEGQLGPGFYLNGQKPKVPLGTAHPRRRRTPRATEQA